jgi:predicted nucleotidyltransferase
MGTDLNIKGLKNYFENRKDIAFAFLFGSQAGGKATRLSDVDIAVYFYPEKRHPIEYEEEVFYEGEDEIWTDVERLLKKEVELLVLNRVSATVAASAIRGEALAINDWGLYLDFMEVVTAEAEDFREMLFRDFLERREFERRAQATITKTS